MRQLSDKPRILLVEDEEDILSTIKSGLERHWVDVDGFSESVAACEHFLSNPDAYDLLLLDIRMPELSGFEFAKKVRESNSDIKIVFMTAFEVNKREFEMLMPSLKIDAFITKPIAPSHLSRLLKSVFAIDGALVADQEGPSKPKRKTIMVCDDERDIVNTYSNALHVKYNVISAFSGRECIKKHMEAQTGGQKIDLLLLDYRLGDMSGSEVARQIKKLDGTQVVLVSAFELEKNIVDDLIRDKSIVLTLKKPLSIKSLTREIDQVLAERC